MTYHITQNSTLFNNYIEVLKSRIFKILPLIEEENEGVYQYVDALTFELYGLQYVIDGIPESYHYISLLCGLESLLDELIAKERDFSFIRSEIFKMIGFAEKLDLKGVSK